VLPLLQVPPVDRSLNTLVFPAHTFVVPVITAGSGFTVSTLVARQVPNVYVIVGAVPPDATPVTIPDVEPTVACNGSLLVHVPPEGEELSVVVAPTHTVGLPVIAVGDAFTVTDAVCEHDVLKV